jgi:hypothetical protein
MMRRRQLVPPRTHANGVHRPQLYIDTSDARLRELADALAAARFDVRAGPWALGSLNELSAVCKGELKKNSKPREWVRPSLGSGYTITHFVRIFGIWRAERFIAPPDGSHLLAPSVRKWWVAHGSPPPAVLGCESYGAAALLMCEVSTMVVEDLAIVSDFCQRHADVLRSCAVAAPTALKLEHLLHMAYYEAAGRANASVATAVRALRIDAAIWEQVALRWPPAAIQARQGDT